MSDTQTPDHDQRLKVLIKEFFEQFFLCFFPDWAKRLDFGEVIFIDKEVFLNPPQGEKRQLDLVARLRLRPDAPPPQAGVTDLVALVHIEVESGESVQPLRGRMYEYYTQLRRDYSLPVLPIGLYMRVGLDGIGWDSYEEHFWEHRILLFEYAYVGLPKLKAEDYVSGEHLLGVALSGLMKASPERRAELYAESLKRIAKSQENNKRQYLLAECLEAYINLDEEQRQQFQRLMDAEHYQEARPLMITTFERGKAEGKAEGKLEDRREIALLQLEEKFPPLPPEVRQRVMEMDADKLRQLLAKIVKATSLDEILQR